MLVFFFFQAEDGIRDKLVTGVQTCALPILFLMALHSTIFSPAKYGIVPEILPDRDLSRGNALLEMSTFVAIVLGIASGGVFFALWKTAAWRVGLVTLLVAAIGLLTSLRITRVKPSGAIHLVQRDQGC